MANLLNSQVYVWPYVDKSATAILEQVFYARLPYLRILILNENSIESIEILSRLDCSLEVLKIGTDEKT